MNIDEQILKIIDRIAEADPGRNITKHREQLLRDIKSRYSLQERRGHIVNRHGVEQDLNQIVALVVDSASYIGRPSNQAEKMKYVSPWIKPTKEQRERMAKEVEQTLEHLVEVHRIQPLDQQAFKKALKLISENMSFGHTDEGKLIFRKANPSGLFGEQTHEFDDLMRTLDHLIDHRATRLEQALDHASRRAVAEKLIGKEFQKNKHGKQIEEKVQENINQLIERDLAKRIPRKSLPTLPKSFIENEFYRREAILRGVDPEVAGGNIAGQLRNVAKHEVERLDDVGELQRQIREIQPQTTTPWEGVSYE